MRVRHYTRVSSMRRIIHEQMIRARDQNRVFVESANRRRLSPTDARNRYGLGTGKANAYIEFDADQSEVASRWNALLKVEELYLVGDVHLAARNPEAFFNM